MQGVRKRNNEKERETERICKEWREMMITASVRRLKETREEEEKMWREKEKRNKKGEAPRPGGP